jgi:hypothetical protein
MFFVRWRIRKPVEQGDRQMSQIHSLFEAYGDEMSPGYQTVINDRLKYADQLKQGLAPEARTCWGQIDRARLYCEYTEETLRWIERNLPDTAPPP